MFEEQRRKIDTIDRQIIGLLGIRFEIVREIGHIKAANAVPVVQGHEVESLMQEVTILAQQNMLDPEIIRHIYTILIGYMHELETEIGDRDFRHAANGLS